MWSLQPGPSSRLQLRLGGDIRTSFPSQMLVFSFLFISLSLSPPLCKVQPSFRLHHDAQHRLPSTSQHTNTPHQHINTLTFVIPNISGPAYLRLRPRFRFCYPLCLLFPPYIGLRPPRLYETAPTKAILSLQTLIAILIHFSTRFILPPTSSLPQLCVPFQPISS